MTTDEILESIYGEAVPDGIRSVFPELVRRRYLAGVNEEISPKEVVDITIVFDMVVKAMKGRHR